MTVSTEVDHNDYTGNGVTTSFPYTFRIFKKSDLVVQVADLSENITELVLDTDYTVTGAGGYTGGNVILSTPLTSGYQISISRELPVTQETDLRNQGKFFAEVHEDAFDKLTMLIQQVRSWLRLALRKPSFVANYYDAMNNYIRNLRDPRDLQDAATKNYVDSVANTNLSHTLRTPEAIPPLPVVEQRKNKIVAMNDSGDPIMVLPESGSAADVLIELAKPTGAELIGTLSGKSVQQELMIKTSSFPTLQDAANYAVNGIIVDEDYHFTDGETVDFGGKVLTIICKKSFISDGSIVFTNLGSGSTIEDISLKSVTTPFVIYRFDDNGNWLDSSAVLAGLSQRRDKGYQPTVNDLDIWPGLPQEVQSQNINCELILGANCSGVTVTRPTGEFAIIRSIMNNNVTVQDPDFLGGKGGFGSIVFANYDGTGYGYGNRVIGGRVRYGSFSSVAFLRNKGYEGGVWGFDSYRCGESGVKTWQNEVGPRSARCYELTFESITTTQCYYDGIDCNADYGTVTTRVDDYPVSQYPSGQLPTKHHIRNVFTEDAKGVGAWWDGQGVYVENVTTKDAHKTGIWSRGTSCILVNLTTIGCNSDNGSYNHLTCEGSDQIIGASVTVYSGISGYAIYAPGSQASNIYTNKGIGAGVVLLTSINNSRLGNTEVASSTETASIYMRPSAYISANESVKIDAVTQVSSPGSESGRLDISAIQGGVHSKTMSLNNGGTGQLTIPAADQLIGDSTLPDNGTLAFYFEAGELKILYKKPDGTYNRVNIG
ncbi:TPA_asm: hypothetical protein GNC16_004796 [Salmonella enterica subsp. enterica serovar Typhimurium]|uniref:P22 tailspike C-terminal domain-containing protein n=1 Tax=Salmonella typhimurium TaxID=90371 RepID=A0A8E6JUJ2_SALTM|nr:tail spike protein [Salmonella enterica]MBL6175132.1 hypothetical protein [Salmonella enterica subsp. enterica serovar Typhimurium]QVP91840.1 hypothetical protein CAC56_06665 [Salmonella enterica subsp. enterica serovar Typhimurium]HAE3814195.1 hypothetical protein [Salmonella enterica subsp. enterica serovar Typhimurium]HAE8638408.1 hypothetical protein [Salmonella enterica subsp. enterica serovar Typhimurium]